MNTDASAVPSLESPLLPANTVPAEAGAPSPPNDPRSAFVPAEPLLPAKDSSPAPAPVNSETIEISSVLGATFVLPQDEQIRLMTLEYNIEESMNKGWNAFVAIGAALIEIKESHLYRAQNLSFEEYCSARWRFHHSKANYLMAAARFVKGLEALPDAPKPQSEWIVRPLLRLGAEDAHRAWNRAVELANGREITARLVTAAIREQDPGHSDRADNRKERVQRLSRRAQINEGFGDLLRLVAQRADYAVLTQKIEVLCSQCQSLFAPVASKARQK